MCGVSVFRRVMLRGVSDTYNSSSFSLGVAVRGGRIRLLESRVVVRLRLYRQHAKGEVKLFALTCIFDGKSSAN